MTHVQPSSHVCVLCSAVDQDRIQEPSPAAVDVLTMRGTALPNSRARHGGKSGGAKPGSCTIQLFLLNHEQQQIPSVLYAFPYSSRARVKVGTPFSGNTPVSYKAACNATKARAHRSHFQPENCHLQLKRTGMHHAILLLLHNFTLKNMKVVTQRQIIQTLIVLIGSPCIHKQKNIWKAKGHK